MRCRQRRCARRCHGLARIRPLHFHEQVPRLHVARLAVVGDGGAQSLRPRAQLLVKFVTFLDIRKDLIGFGETSLDHLDELLALGRDSVVFALSYKLVVRGSESGQQRGLLRFSGEQICLQILVAFHLSGANGILVRNREPGSCLLHAIVGEYLHNIICLRLFRQLFQQRIALVKQRFELD